MNDNKILGVGSRVKHPAYGNGVVVGIDTAAYKVVFIDHGIKAVGKNYTAWDIIEAIEEDEISSFNKFEHSLVKVLRKWSDITEDVPYASKWDGGVMILKPGDDSQSKEIELNTFFHKIVMVRDRLRIIEQRINSSNLTEEEKVSLQQYITRIYGSLTTFNVLFKHKEDFFVGDRAKKN